MVTDPNLNHTEEAIKKLEFLVVQDIFHTETTPYADVILPASAFAEKNGTFVNSDRRVLRVRKAVDMPGQARQDWQIITEIARRMGKPLGNYKDESDIWDEIARAAPIFSGISYQRLEEKTIQWPCPTPDHPGTATLFTERFNTPNGLGKLHPVDYAAQTEKVSAEYPFLLNTGRILYQYHSSTMSRKNTALTDYANESFLLMNPDDVHRYGFQDGDWVKVRSRQGELMTRLETSDHVLPGELFMPFHYSEASVNKLTRDELDPYSKIAPFKLSAVRVEKVNGERGTVKV